MERGSARAFGPDVDVDAAAYLHPTAQIYGQVQVSAQVSIWPNVVVRAESQEVRIGRGTNIQDLVMIHVGNGTGTIIGEDCSITHHCTLHGCRIGDNCIIAGHAFLKEGTIIPANSIVMGAPGKVIRERNSGAANAFNAWMYAQNAEAYARGEHRLWASEAFSSAARVERARLEVLYGAA